MVSFQSTSLMTLSSQFNYVLLTILVPFAVFLNRGLFLLRIFFTFIFLFLKYYDTYFSLYFIVHQCHLTIKLKK